MYEIRYIIDGEAKSFSRASTIHAGSDARKLTKNQQVTAVEIYRKYDSMFENRWDLYDKVK